jgi:hypothetical protein
MSGSGQRTTAPRDFRNLDLDEADHPAKFSPVILETIVDVLGRYPTREGIGRPNKPLRVLDTFAGVGRVHLLRDLYGLPVATTGVELEPEWAAAHDRTIVGDALHLEDAGIGAGTFDCYVTSPCYGNRMADSFVASKPERRNTYHHKLGRRPSVGSIATCRWGPPYRRFHLGAYVEAAWALARPALVVLNVSNHLETIPGDGPASERPVWEHRVSEWHLKAWLHLGALHRATIPVETPRNGDGANRELRTAEEYLHVLVLAAHEAPPR